MNNTRIKSNWKFIPAEILIICCTFCFSCIRSTNLYKPGDPIDNLNGVTVYFNGHSWNILGKNFAPDGYYLGLKYQCVEFVKRYYYLHLNSK